MLRDNAVNANLQPLSHLTVPALLRHAYMKRVQTYNPSDGIRRQLYQGTPTYATGITPVPLHRGA